MATYVRWLIPLIAVLSAGATQIQMQPLVVTAGDPDSDLYQTPPGTGYDGVAALRIQSTAGDFSCTGALLTTGVILTAAHCLTDATGTVNVVSLTAGFRLEHGTELVQASGYVVHPDWNGVLQQGGDVALVVLANAPSPEVQRYELYDGSADLGAIYEFAGWGMHGTGSEGAIFSDGNRRRGWNTFDATMKQTFSEFDGWTGGNDVLISDFDNGLAANDALGYFYEFPGPGLGTDEAFTSRGDSGAPAFINGKIAGVNMFRVRLEFPDGSTSDIDDLSNSTYGEFNAWARMSSYRDWVYAVPEPSTTALCLLSLAAIGFVARRRRA